MLSPKSPAQLSIKNADPSGLKTIDMMDEYARGDCKLNAQGQSFLAFITQEVAKFLQVRRVSVSSLKELEMKI